jgi:hypothetical protein
MARLGPSSGSGAASKAAAAEFDTSGARHFVFDLGPVPAFARRVYAGELGVFFSVGDGASAHPAPPNGQRELALAQRPAAVRTRREKQPNNQRPRAAKEP